MFDMFVCVEYAKTFPFFHYLSEEDQIVLTKNVTVLCFMLTQAFFSYENNSDNLLHPDGTGLPPPLDERFSHLVYYIIASLDVHIVTRSKKRPLNL